MHQTEAWPTSWGRLGRRPPGLRQQGEVAGYQVPVRRVMARTVTGCSRRRAGRPWAAPLEWRSQGRVTIPCSARSVRVAFCLGGRERAAGTSTAGVQRLVGGQKCFMETSVSGVFFHAKK